MRRGPKDKSRIEYARAAYWVCNLSFISGKSFTDLEREITPWAIKKRDGGGYIQPHAFKKYATGQRTPLAVGEKSPIVIAEKLYPGSSAVYKSIFWEIVNTVVGKSINLKEVYSRANPDVIKHFRNGFFSEESPPLLNQFGKYEARLIANIDAFALLLLTIRYDEAITISDIYDLQSWLLLNSKVQPFAMCSSLLLSVFEEYIPEVGVLTGPMGFIADTANRHLNAAITALTSGRVIEWET